MYLNSLKNIAKASVVFVLTVAAMANPSEAQAQDLIARQAPIDRKMKAVDSVVINKAITRQQPVVEVNYEQTELYTTWDTKTVHCYGKQQTPDRYTIDLRGFAMPTPSKVVTSNYGYRASFGRMHKGLDVKVYIGDTIVSAFDGKVRIVNYEAKGYGNYVVIRHNNGLETIYGHLSKHLCKTGDVVKAGQPIGLGGNTGRSTGSHLHFETRILGEAINPALLFDFVHQDVTGDFFEYRRNGGGAVVASKPKSNPAPVAKATTPAKPAAPAAPAKAPAKSSTPAAPAKAPAKSTTPAAPAKGTTAPAKAPAKSAAPATQATAKASVPAAPAKAKTKAAAPAQGGKATAKADAPAAQGTKTKAAAPAAPAKTKTAAPAQGTKTKAAAPAQGGKATAKASAPAAPAKAKAATPAAPKTKAAAPAQGGKTKAAAPAAAPKTKAAPAGKTTTAPKGGKATATAGKGQGKPKA